MKYKILNFITYSIWLVALIILLLVIIYSNKDSNLDYKELYYKELELRNNIEYELEVCRFINIILVESGCKNE